MIDENEILKRHPLLSILPTDVLDQVISRSSIEVHPKGTVLLEEGKPCKSLYLILSGRCEAFRKHPAGLRKTVEIHGPGDLFGDKGFTCPVHYPVSIEVITDSVLQRIDVEDVQTQLAEYLAGQKGENERNPAEPELQLNEPSLVPAPGRVVTFSSLSRRIPDRMMVEQVAQSLHETTGESVLLVEFTKGDRGQNLVDWARSSAHSGYGVPDTVDDGGWSRLCLQLTGAAHEPGFIAPVISHFGRFFRYVFLHVSGGQMVFRAGMECMIQADLTFLFTEEEPRESVKFHDAVNAIRSQTRASCTSLKAVVCLEQGKRPHALQEPEAESISAHAHVHDCPLVDDNEAITPISHGSDRLKSDLRRLAREIGRCRTGLALSSGGAKGLAHIGVIQVLEENGIEIDVVAGCSMGSYVAAVWACGFDGKRMEKLARELESPWGLWKLIDPSLPPRRGFIQGNAVRKRLMRSVGDSHFSEMVRPLRIVATHLDTLERVIFQNGEVAAAVHASCAIPGVVVPVDIDGQTYVDGGVSDPLPIDVLREMGVEKIIAVNTIPTPAFLRCCLELEREKAERKRGSSWVLEAINQQVNYFAGGNILDIMMRAVHGSQIRVAEAACLDADVVMRPLAIDAQWHDFTHPGKYISLGRKVAEEHLDELRALVRSPVRKHESSSAEKKLAVVA